MSPHHAEISRSIQGEQSLERLDVSPVMAVARPIVHRAAVVYLRHTAPWFVGLIVHGSALKGGFIPGCSDVDFQLFVDRDILTHDGQLPLDIGVAVQRDLAHIDPAPFRYIQCKLASATGTQRIVGPVSGAYYVLAGRLPVPEATVEQLRNGAHHALAALDPVPAFMASSLLDHGGGRLAANIRLLCTKVWPVLYQVLVLQQEDAIHVWRLPKGDAITHLPSGTELRRAMDMFYRAVQAYYPTEESIERALDVVTSGVDALRAAKEWWQECRAPRVSNDYANENVKNSANERKK